MTDIIAKLAEELKQPWQAVRNVAELLDGGNTIPFIARYRKEAHGAMDDTTLRKLQERLCYLRGLEERKTEILEAISLRGKLTEELRAAIEQAETMSEAEELYRPFKQKKRTRASIAREKGLEPLADRILGQTDLKGSLEEEAAGFVDPEKGVDSPAQALSGAADIIAESLAASAGIRQGVKELMRRQGMITSRAAESKEKDSGEEAENARDNRQDKSSVYDLYKDFSQPVARIRDHQVLALNRGEKEGFLKVSVEFDGEEAIRLMEKQVIRPSNRGNETGGFLKEVIRDSYDRLLAPSVKNELREALTEKASEGAVHNFASNLKPLLLQPPVKGRVTMGLDPGYRMGCKVAVVDATGKVLDTAVVYPTQGQRKREEAINTLVELIRRHQVEHIAIGNGTASRETEQMTCELIRQCPGTSYMVVSEAGASVYSASELAAREFPEYDVNLRSAISIARRLQDPLSELVKIDPKSIGVGQYQHDLPQKLLETSLDAVVEDCVNLVGVDLNTASVSLLKRVAGLNAVTAGNIVAYREENGAYTSRSQLKKVPRLGPKAFEQCAGFLRIPGSRNLLDNTAVHPESYKAAQKLLELAGLSAGDLKAGGVPELSGRIRRIGEGKAARECGIGVPTLQDIVQELSRPGRDPREELPAPIFRTDLLEIKDLKPGMILTGTVRNVIDFGAFVDIGVHQDGLVHISEITDRYIKHPSEVLTVGEDVRVLVLSVDEKKKRISLSIRQAKNRD